MQAPWVLAGPAFCLLISSHLPSGCACLDSWVNFFFPLLYFLLNFELDYNGSFKYPLNFGSLIQKFCV